MKTPKPQQKQSRKTTVPIILGILILIPVSMLVLSKVKYGMLHHKVLDVVQSELQSIPLSNSSGLHKVGDSGCDYDEKVRAVRCTIMYTRYFGTNEADSSSVLNEINKKLNDLGWKISTFDEGYLSGGWQPRSPTFDLGVRFYKNGSLGYMTLSPADRSSFRDTTPDYDSINAQFKFMYKLDVHSDFIPDGYKWY